MKDYPRLKERATELRQQGLSYNEIRKKVPVSKSTLSLWLKNVPLKKKDRERLYTKQIQLLSRGSQSQKERRAREIESIIADAEKEIKVPVSPETMQLMGAALYWAEGSKGKHCSFTNSDPRMILFFVRWVKKIFGIPPKQLKAKLNIYPQQDDRGIKKFWSGLTKIPLARFGRSYVKPVSSGFKKNTLYYGTICIYVPKSTDSKHRIFGWIQAVLKTVDPQVKKAARKWVSLSNTPRPVNLTKSNRAPIT